MACCSDEDKFPKENLLNLKLYYKKLMPLNQLYRWFSYGKSETFAKREISFTLNTGAYIRYQSFDTEKDFFDRIQEISPIKIDIGAIYKTKPKIKALGFELTAIEKELVFDIDISDYDEVRTCCSGAEICKKCWKFLAVASKIITIVLKEDFNYEHLLWVFSGRRGIHCWVADKHARKLTNETRSAITEYLTLLKDGNKSKKVTLAGRINKKIYQRALKIIDEYFITILEEQDLLGNNLMLKRFLSTITDAEFRKQIKKSMKSVKNSLERWEQFEKKLTELPLPDNLQNLREEIKLQYTYPRLDVHVSRSLDHLLKAPFCVHQKTGKICIPFDVEQVDDFDPDEAPTISSVFDEMKKYDEYLNEQSKILEVEDILFLVVEDYEKTSLKKPIDLLVKFVDNLEKDEN